MDQKNDVFSVVKMSKSNAEQVVLKKVQINSSGYYKCEVSPGYQVVADMSI